MRPRCPNAGPAPALLSLLALLALGACWSTEEPSPAPEGWRLVYSEDFESGSIGLDYVFSDPTAWRVGGKDGNRFLEQRSQSAYAPPYRSPLNIAVLAGPWLGDFVLELDVLQTGREYDHRDACILFGVQDPAHFNYAHLASRADDSAHQVQLVTGADRAPVTHRRNFGVDWGRGEWRHVRVERSLALSRLRVWFDYSPDPVLEAREGALGEGWIGLGTFDDSARFDNLVLWAPELEVRSPAFFAPLAAGGVER